MRPISILVLALTAGVAHSQESRATIIGRATDPTGAVLSGANVKATNTATNATVDTMTNDSGSFDMPYLLPGVYTVTVEMAGFKKAVREKVQLRIGERMTLDFALALGDVSESVKVTAETPMLEASSADMGLVMEQRRVQELPVVGGNPFYLTRLTAGVLSSGGRSAGNPMDNGGATGIIVNGTRSNSSEATVDGSPVMTNRNASFSPPQDLVQEFKVNTATYDASIGHAAGAMTNVSMKSGTNTVHGTAFLDRSTTRAVPWFTNRFLYDPKNNVKPEDRDKQIPSWLHRRGGNTMTGPVWIPKVYNGKNKTFWTFGFEDLLIQRNLSFTGTVPTEAQRRGDFSSLLKLGATYQVYDPFTTVPAANGRFSRTPLAGNMIPASRLDPVGAKIASFYPAANQPGQNAEDRNNYFITQLINRENYTLTSRVDHNFSSKNRLFFRWFNQQHDNDANRLLNLTNIERLDRTAWGAVIDDVHVFNPGLLLNVRYGINFENNTNSTGSQGFDLTSLGFPSSLVTNILNKLGPNGISFPDIQVDSNAYTEMASFRSNSTTTNYSTASATLTKLSGKHSTRYGVEYRLMRETAFNYGNVAPQLVFAGTYTRGPLDNTPLAAIGQGMASMLLGIASGGTINNNASSAQNSKYWGFFVQDDWRLTTKLSINLGLRYEYESPVTERYNRTIRGFDFSTANPVSQQALANYTRNPISQVPAAAFRTAGGLLFAGVGGQPSAVWTADKNNFAPRIGFAYQFNQKTVLRGGYGIFYDVLGVDRNDVNQGGFNQPTSLIPSLDNGQTYIATLKNPFPGGIDSALGAAGGLTTFLGRGISFFNERPLNPYNQRWSLSVQRQLPQRILLEVSYVGNRGTKLPVTRELNAVPSQYLSTAPVRDQPVIDLLTRQVTNPFFGISQFSGTGLANQSVALSQLLRPYPQFTSVQTTVPAGFSYYHSMQMAAEKRMSGGLSFQMSWTYSKFMEATSYRNDTDARPEKVVSNNDFTHRFVLSTIYELPFGRSRKWLNSMPFVTDAIFGGWQLQGWFEGQTGDALGFGNAIFNGDLHNLEISKDQRRAERWFNIDAGFNRSSAQVLANNIQGLSTRFNGVRSDGINNFDLSFFKNIRIKERVTAQFRLESFNSLNHVQFDVPNTNPVNAAFGSITGEKGHGQRQITVGVKVLF
ncbi:MAG: TonB-dependent receptor [Candidatus Solibacter usitatus]|nr:TonB-dependent receptor [Candidatus Solibacter usitatus]